MLNVFITIDTEVWPLLADWRTDNLKRDIDRDIYGLTPDGPFGISYKLDVFDKFGLKGVFFVEPFFSEVAGHGRLRKIVAEIQERGHEVQVHLHPEWLQWMDAPILPGSRAELLKDFSQNDQLFLIRRAIALLNACGSDQLCAFRAGDYAADIRTLRALRQSGITYDTSHNTCYLRTCCGLNTLGELLQPTHVEGVYEMPVSYFRDFPNHYRHAQLTACSFPELRSALLQAWKQNWYSFVIVSHSFELLQPRRRDPSRPKPDKIVIRRFNKLCSFLAENQDKFRTSGFNGISAPVAPVAARLTPLKSTPYGTFQRLVEQVGRRLSF